jgi:hypothetical protein
MSVRGMAPRVEPKAGQHYTRPTPDRGAAEFAQIMAELALNYPTARMIHLVVDNLNTHCRKSLTEYYGEDADRFLEQLRERVGKFGLELHPEKTRLIEFGRYAAERRKKRGEGKPGTFNFLGFTHICGTSHKAGHFPVNRQTIGKRMAAKLSDIQAKLRQRMHGAIGDTLEWLQSVVRGYFQYHAIPDNEERLRAFRKDVLRLWLRQLRRRSQRRRWTWERFQGNLRRPAACCRNPASISRRAL